MFKCDELIYLEMQKTASSHIVKLLQQLFGGQVIGKHNCATAEQIDHAPYVISSIRNPWEWYLSLWSFGVGGRGSVWQHLTQKHWWELLRSIHQEPAKFHQTCIHFFQKDTDKWRNLYRNDDVQSFRRWLAGIHDPNTARYLSRGYTASANSQHIGLMTYRYLRLCCRFEYWHKHLTDLNFTDLQTLKKFDEKYCYIDYFIRQENVGETFIHAIQPIRTLSSVEKSAVNTMPKTNVSIRKLPITDYYDQASIDLIDRRDQLLIEKFNYSPMI